MVTGPAIVELAPAYNVLSTLLRSWWRVRVDF